MRKKPGPFKVSKSAYEKMKWPRPRIIETLEGGEILELEDRRSGIKRRKDKETLIPSTTEGGRARYQYVKKGTGAMQMGADKRSSKDRRQNK